MLAFYVMKDRWLCAPGVIFPGVVGMYRSNSAMRHALFLPPFLWLSLKSLELSGRHVAWLLLVPISDEEMRCAESKGVDRLERLFEDNHIDIFDVDRPSVV